ncbi:mediator of RNA polymerase II transcription subunit 19 [Parathielavia appendiculata]|uniref:Mediator of RNA polymerase II transcription subunit 19 n=1 Tax=Parathielavia appendiculata TaxID=2587402 RepID=A0AAN6Z7E4_9PEZI|nr:mediator of RNA polymerase II transcription subunit 19 [Parathielavia appendiculata]
MSCHPQTPDSPSQFSPNASDLMMSMTAASTTTTLPTPAHSVNGSSIPTEMTHDTVMGEDSPQKRKRHVNDTGDRAQKKVHVEDRKSGIDDLHLDVGDKYLLCRTPHPRPRPQVSEDLFEMYGLTRLAAEVARVLPNGEKNALRKTYKGHIKKLGVQGHFDEVKQDPHREEGLLFLTKLPQDVWDVHYVRGKEIDKGFSNEARQKLPRSVTMGKGTVPKSLWDSSVLGDLAPGKGEKRAESARPTAPSTPLPTAAVLPRPKVGTPLPQDAARTKRNAMKRSYGDSSFEGYGEGFPDDETGAETGYSTGEGDMFSGQKRRKKVLING